VCDTAGSIRSEDWQAEGAFGKVENHCGEARDRAKRHADEQDGEVLKRQRDWCEGEWKRDVSAGGDERGRAHDEEDLACERFLKRSGALGKAELGGDGGLHRAGPFVLEGLWRSGLVCLTFRPGGDHLWRFIPAFLRQNISQGLLRDGVRHTRVSIFNGCEEMLSEVVLRRSRCPARAHVPDHGDSREHESGKTESRNGKESTHACLRRITRCMGFVQLIRSARRFDGFCSEEPMDGMN
jgi:hypothetical protein